MNKKKKFTFIKIKVKNPKVVIKVFEMSFFSLLLLILETRFIKITVGYPAQWILVSYNDMGYLLKGLERQVPILIIAELCVNLF